MQDNPDSVNKWLALILVSIGTFMGTLDASIVNISFPLLAKVFETDASVVLWVSVAYLLITASLMLILGRIADVISRRLIYIFGLFLFTIGLALCSFSQTILQLILSRVIQGTGAAMVVALGMAIVTEAFPAHERGKALGILGAVVSVGLLTGPILGGFILDLLDWRALFYTRVPIGIFGIVFSLIFLKEKREKQDHFTFDLSGAASLFCGLASLILFFNLGGKWGFLSPLVLILGLTAGVSLCLFILSEAKADQPIVDLELFQNLTFAIGNICVVILYVSVMGFVFLTPFYFIDGLGISAARVGLLMSLVPLSNSVTAPFSGWLSDRVDPRPLRTFGLCLLCIALFLFGRLDTGSEMTDIWWRAALIGLSLGFFDAPNNNAIMGSVPQSRLGTAAAMISTSRQLGIVVGTAIMGTLFSVRQVSHLAMLNQGLHEKEVLAKLSMVGAFRDTLLIATLFSLAGIVISLVAFKAQKKAPHVQGY